MVKRAFCPYCWKETELKKSKFSWGCFLAWGLLFGFGALVYTGYHITKPKTRCHICGAKTREFFKNKYKKEQVENV